MYRVYMYVRCIYVCTVYICMYDGITKKQGCYHTYSHMQYLYMILANLCMCATVGGLCCIAWHCQGEG